MPVTNEINVVGVRRSSDSEIIYTQEQSKSGFSTAVTSGNIDVDSLPLPTVCDSISGTSGDSFSTVKDFGANIKTLRIIAETNGLTVQVSVDNTNWSDDIDIPSNSIFSIDMSIRYIKHKNRTAGSDCIYTIEGYL